MQDAEHGSRQPDGPVHRWEDQIRDVHHLAHLLLRRIGGDQQPVALQIQDTAAHPRLRGGECHGEVVLLLKIPVIGAVVHMGVGAQDACRLQPRLQQGLLDLIPLLGQPAVQENTPPVVQQVQGDQLVGLQHPGAALHLCQLHLLLLCPHLPR